MRACFIPCALALVLPPLAPAAAQNMAGPQNRPVVVELFTSQSCSSCPPADALLTSLAQMRRDDVLPLSFHITYWDNLGWHDPFSLSAATERQRAYAVRLPEHFIYTPQMVVNGTRSFVGSDRSKAEAVIRQAKAEQVAAAPLHLHRQGGDLVVELGAGTGTGTVLLVGFDPAHSTAVAHGENSGRQLLESNIVRSIRPLGQWTGQPLRIAQPVPAGTAFAVLLEAPDGQIIGAARLG